MIVLLADPARRVTPGRRRTRGRGSWLAFASAIAASATLHAAVLMVLAGRGETAVASFEAIDVVALPGIDPPLLATAWVAPGIPPSRQTVQQTEPVAVPVLAHTPPGGFVAVASASGPSAAPSTAAPPSIVPPTITHPGVAVPTVNPPAVAPPRGAPPAGFPSPAMPPAIAPVPAARPPAQTGTVPVPPVMPPSASPPPAEPPAGVAPPAPPVPVQPPPRKVPAQRSLGTPGPAPQTSSDPAGEITARTEPRVLAALPGSAASPSPRGQAAADTVARPAPGNAPPVYPVAARRAHREGRVVLLVAVSGDGAGRDIRVAQSSGTPSLDDAAAQAVRAWRFIPAMRNGVAADDAILVPVVFRLTP
jgi:protein TonB